MEMKNSYYSVFTCHHHVTLTFESVRSHFKQPIYAVNIPFVQKRDEISDKEHIFEHQELIPQDFKCPYFQRLLLLQQFLNWVKIHLFQKIQILLEFYQLLSHDQHVQSLGAPFLNDIRIHQDSSQDIVYIQHSAKYICNPENQKVKF